MGGGGRGGGGGGRSCTGLMAPWAGPSNSYIATVCMLMAYGVTAYVVMTYIPMVYVVMVYVVVADVVMVGNGARCCRVYLRHSDAILEALPFGMAKNNQ